MKTSIADTRRRQPASVQAGLEKADSGTGRAARPGRRMLLRASASALGAGALAGCSFVAAPVPRAPAPEASGPRARADLERLLHAHGGLARWRSVRRLDARLSSGGFAFASRFQADALKSVRVRVAPHERRVELVDYAAPGWVGHWTPERVSLADAGGRTLATRDAPRARFDRFSARFAWDRLDALYFAGYAIWNYLSFPFLLAGQDVAVSLPGPDAPGEGRRLVADFAPGFPTHSARQLFHLDDAWHLTRHDYTADVMGRWATAANLVDAATTVDGLRFYTRRRVLPRLGSGHAIQAWPLLVWIEIDDLAVDLGPA